MSSEGNNGAPASLVVAGDVRRPAGSPRGGWWRFAPLPLFACALACAALAIASRLTHRHPLQTIGLANLVGAATYSGAEQTCEMSYFSPSHVERPVKQLSPLSQDMLQGRLAFGTTPTAAATAEGEDTRRRAKRRNAEFDDEDDEEADVEDDAPTPPAAAVEDSPERVKLKEEFASFARLFLSALPYALAPQASSRYKLYQFVEHDRSGHERLSRDRSSRHTPPHNLLPRVPVLFIHGNGGSYHQMRSLASRLAAIYAEERDASLRADPAAAPQQAAALLPDLNDYYTVEMFEESGAFSGRLLWRQAWFVNEAMGEILHRYPADTKLVIVGHSMGGVVARALWGLGNFPRDASGQSRVAMVATLGSPHRAPVVTTDEWMKRLYDVLNRPVRAPTSAREGQRQSPAPLAHLYPLLNLNTSIQAEKPFVLSVSGGERDFQVEPALTELDGLYSADHALSIASHSIQHAPLSESGGSGSLSRSSLGSVDHQCLCWCRQLMETLAFSIRDLTRNLLDTHNNQTRHGLKETIARQKALWLPAALPALRTIAALPVVSSPPHSPSLEWAIFDDQFARTTGPLSVRLDVSNLEDGLVSVWTGLMSSVAFCTVATPSVCTDVSSHVRLLAPHLHPEHAALPHAVRIAKRLGLVSTYLLHLSAADFAALQLPSSGPLDLVLQPEEATLGVLRQLRPLRGGLKRMLVYGMSYRVAELPAASESLPNRGAAYRWTRQIPAGLDTHLDVLVNAHTDVEHEYPLPQLVTLFAAASEAADESIAFPPSSYSDQLFTFFPRSSSASPQSRSIHVSRSGVPRQLVGLLLRFPDRLVTEASSASASGASEGAVRVSFREHELVSFMHTLYLQLQMLPQLLFGTSLILFGVQHEYLRKYAAFPRVYQLLAFPATLKPADWLASIFVWGLVAIIAGFHAFFHGSLAGDPAVRSAGDGLWSGWTLSRSASWSLGWIGLILFFSCILVHALLEAVVYGLLWIGSKLLNAAWSFVAWPFRSATDAQPQQPQQRPLVLLFRRLALVTWIGLFLLASVFTSSLSLFALQYFGGPSLVDHLYFVGQQLVALVSTFPMLFGLLSEHLFFSQLLDWLQSHATLDHNVAIVLLIGGVVLVTLLLQMATFPTAAAAAAPTSEWKRRTSASSAAYKASLVTMMLLVALLLVTPQFLSTFRLDVGLIEHAWAKQQSHGRLLFTPPAAPKVYDQSMVAAGLPPPAGIAAAPCIFLYPFVVTSPFDPLSAVTLLWVTLVGWCAFHVPFSPPILQSACITTYGLALVFVHGPAVAFLNLWWMALMLCLCMLPHALASGLYILHLIWDFAEGREGNYEQMYARETSLHQPQSTQPTPSTGSPATAATAAPAPENKKRK